jgi:hypothetical protein
MKAKRNIDNKQK